MRERAHFRKLVVEMTQADFERFEESAEARGITVNGLAAMLVADFLNKQDN